MSYWNYRLVKHEGFCTIRELHYDDNGKPKAYTIEPVYPAGTNKTSVIKDLEMMLKCVKNEPSYTLQELNKIIKGYK